MEGEIDLQQAQLVIYFYCHKKNLLYFSIFQEECTKILFVEEWIYFCNLWYIYFLLIKNIVQIFKFSLFIHTYRKWSTDKVVVWVSRPQYFTDWLHIYHLYLLILRHIYNSILLHQLRYNRKVNRTKIWTLRNKIIKMDFFQLLK